MERLLPRLGFWFRGRCAAVGVSIVVVVVVAAVLVVRRKNTPTYVVGC